MMAIDGKAVARLSDEQDTDHIERIIHTPLSDKQLTSVIEASLIRYFRPEYNEIYKNRFPQRNHSILQQCYDLDFCSILTALVTSNVGLRLYSSQVRPSLNHVAYFDLHNEIERKTFFMLLNPADDAA